MKKFLFFLLISFFSQGSYASLIALVDLYSPHDIKVAFVSNPINADCRLLRSDFTSNLASASIKVATVSPSLAQKLILIVDNPFSADPPSCLLR